MTRDMASTAFTPVYDITLDERLHLAEVFRQSNLIEMILRTTRLIILLLSHATQ